MSRHFRPEVIGFPVSREVRPDAVAYATEPIAFAFRQSRVDLDAVSQLGHRITLWFKADERRESCELSSHAISYDGHRAGGSTSGKKRHEHLPDWDPAPFGRTALTEYHMITRSRSSR